MHRIRPATQEDRPAIEAIVEAAYRPYVARIGAEPGPMRDDYGALIEAGHVHVLDIAGAVEGVLVLIPEATAMLLDNVAVRAKGIGLGRTLLTFAEQQARDAGYTSIRLYTHEKMTENIELYSRLGYAETHRAEQRGLKRVFMAKPLPTA